MESNNLLRITATIPDDIRKKIRNAWIAGIFSGCITLILTVVAMSGNSILGFSTWAILDVIFVFGLTFGIYKRSRTCATAMLVYFIIAKIIMFSETANVPIFAVFIAFMWAYFYFNGAVGTFQYHTWLQKQPKP